MFIKTRIDMFLQNVKLYNKKYELVDKKRVQMEFLYIKSSLYNLHKNGDVVGISLDTDYKYLLTILACMSIGLTYVPLRLSWPTNRIKQIEELASIKTLITAEYINNAIQLSEVNSGTFEIKNDKPLYYMFTSGSTGKPKGVIIKRESYENFLKWIDSYFNTINEKDKVLNSTDFTFDVSLVEVGIAIMKNASFYTSNFINDIFVLMNELHNLKITTIATVPNNFIQLLDTGLIDRVDLSELRYILIAGARFPQKLYNLFREKLPTSRVYNCFGPTEATVYCLAIEFSYEKDKDEIVEDTVSIGKSILNTEAKIIGLNNDDIIDKPYTKGELIIGGIQVMSGYLNDENNTNKALINVNSNIYYKTGDLVFKDKNDNFFVVGRRDDTIKVSGQRVNLSDVDGYVHTLDYIRDCATIDVDDVKKDKILYLFVTLKYDKSKNEIKDDLKKILLSFQLPSAIIILDQLPQNNSGKICKQTLRDMI